MISGSDVGRRATRHRAVIDVATSVGLGVVAYPTILFPDVSSTTAAIRETVRTTPA